MNADLTSMLAEAIKLGGGGGALLKLKMHAYMRKSLCDVPMRVQLTSIYVA